MLVDLLTVAVMAFFAVRLGSAAKYATWGNGRARAARIVRGIRWRHVWPVPLVLSAVIVVGSVLVTLPVLSFGWWSAIGGVGNPVTGASEQTTGTVFEWLVPLVFLVLLLPALPLFAEREEELFRAGAEEWSWPQRVGRALLFGAAHALIGIPLGFALALGIGGGYFQACYLRAWRRTGLRTAALEESTRAHTTYNLAVMLAVLLYVVSVATGV